VLDKLNNIITITAVVNGVIPVPWLVQSPAVSGAHVHAASLSPDVPSLHDLFFLCIRTPFNRHHLATNTQKASGSSTFRLFQSVSQHSSNKFFQLHNKSSKAYSCPIVCDIRVTYLEKLQTDTDHTYLQENTVHVNPSQAGCYLIYLPKKTEG